MQGRIVVGICGASGVRYGVDLLRALAAASVETHLVLSEWAEVVIQEETGLDAEEVRTLAAVVHDNKNLAASISSSSFLVEAMVVIPASVKTVSDIASGSAGSLIARAADNMLKTRRRLVVCPRETPLSLPALENLRMIALAGGIVAPLSPGFYHRPQSLDELYRFMVGKVLDLLGIDNQQFHRWNPEGED